MKRPRRASVIVAFSLVAWAATASAECAWILWFQMYVAGQGLRGPVDMKSPFEAFDTRRECEAWATACDEAGHPGILLHDLRRSAVRNMEQAGVPRSVAMKVTGRRSESIYMRYAIVAEADLDAATARIEARARAAR